MKSSREVYIIHRYLITHELLDGVRDDSYLECFQNGPKLAPNLPDYLNGKGFLECPQSLFQFVKNGMVAW